MSGFKDIIYTILGPYTISQKMNYIKYSLSKPGEQLRYDPLTISVVATGKCTLACDMCPTHSRVVPKDYAYIQSPTKDLSFEDFKKVVDKFHNALNVHIIGSGEPLLNKDFFRMVEYAAADKRMKVKTFSNGTTIDANSDNIINSRLDGITISLNGNSPEEFNRMTGCAKDNYYKIYNSIARLIKARDLAGSKVKIKISFIIDRINYKYIPSMIDIGDNLGADYIFFCNFLPAPYAGFTAEERMLFADDKKIASEIKHMYEKIGPALKKKISMPDFIDNRSARGVCNTYFTQIRTDGEARVSSCSIMLLNMEGNGTIFDDDVWNNAFFRKMRRLFLSGRREEMPEACRVCPENFGKNIIDE